MKVLVTGGTGYIGSHTIVELILKKHEISIVDNLSNSNMNVLDRIHTIQPFDIVFNKYDVCDLKKMDELFEDNNFDAVIHFAGLKAVGESVEKPVKYYRNNLLSTLVVAQCCIKYNVNKIIFSSSATVYGDQESPLHEGMKLGKTTNPYGETKAMSERILTDAAKVNPNLEVTLLRYFNPVGAHESGLIGEDPNDIPNNLMPYVTKVAKGELKELSVYGNDYDTVDGTGVRDYIHVVDLAKGHVKALEHSKPGVNIYNLGSGKGTSVLELVNAFIKENKVDVPYKIVGRRQGDIATSYADPSKANKFLNWQTEKTINDMVRDAWNFEKNNK